MMGSRREQGVRRKSPAETAGAPRGDRCRRAKCFAEKGLHGASVADIAREAGLSVGQLYRIFASKEAIIEAIVSEIVNARVGEMIDENHNLARKAAVLAGRIPTSAATKSDNYLLMEDQCRGLA